MTSSFKFEYTSRWAIIQEMMKSGQTDDAMRALEDRDRKLEEFLNTLGGGTVGQSIFSYTQDIREFSIASGGHSTSVTVAFTLPAAVSGFNFYADIWTHALVFSQSMSGDCDYRASCVFLITEFAPGTGWENFGWSERDRAIQGDGFVLTASGRRVYDLTSVQTSSDQTLHVEFIWTNDSLPANLPSVFYKAQSSIQVYTTPQ